MELEAMAAKCTAVAGTFDEQLQGRMTEMIDASVLLCEDYSRRVVDRFEFQTRGSIIFIFSRHS